MSGPVIPNQGFLSVGLTPLAYMGVRPTSPAQYLIETRDPTTTDKNYILGTWWFNNNSPYNLWRLVNLNAGVALWILVNASPGALLSLTSNAGGPVFPLAGNINVVGDGVTITGVGNPGTHTITFSLIGGQAAVDSLTGNSGGTVFPDGAGNINVIGDGVTATVAGNPGTNTLTITSIGTGTVKTLTGNSGGAVGPDVAGNINTIGDTVNNITITGNPGTNTLTAAVTGTTNHSLQVGNAAGSLTSLAVAANGELPIGSAGANPVIATLTAGAGISITNGAGSITIASTAASFAYFEVYQSTTNFTNVTGDGTNFVIPFNTVVVDNLAGYNTGTGVYTIPQTGLYQFGANIGYLSVVTGGTVWGFRFNKNGTSAISFGGGLPTANLVANFYGANLCVDQQLVGLLSCTSGDLITCSVDGSGGAKVDGIQSSEANPGINTFFYGYRIA